MVVGILQFELHVPWSTSLKDKRRVVRSVCDRLRREQHVSVAETGAQEMLNMARLGLACVGTDGRRVGQALDRVMEMLRAVPDAELGDTQRDILRGDMIEEPAIEDGSLGRAGDGA
jgi:uncharacterized protein YlxP (DUF503 family)